MRGKGGKLRGSLRDVVYYNVLTRFADDVRTKSVRSVVQYSTYVFSLRNTCQPLSTGGRGGGGVAGLVWLRTNEAAIYRVLIDPSFP